MASNGDAERAPLLADRDSRNDADSTTVKRQRKSASIALICTCAVVLALVIGLVAAHPRKSKQRGCLGPSMPV